MSTTQEQLKRWYQGHHAQIVQDFFTFLRFPSISTDPQYHPRARDCAAWLCAYMNGMGLQTELWETPGLPVVFGTYLQAGPERPTLLLYHHYDVQPVDPLELWHSDPFEPVIRDNTVYARGAVDNKGQCFYSLTALKAILELAKTLNLNIKVFIEGEEESGGKGTAAILQQKRADLKADHLLVVDFDIPSIDAPGITLGMRGLVSWDVECANSSIDLHSGVHGGVALNPNRALASMLSQLWDETGRVTLPHFYDGVQPLSQELRARIDMSFDAAQYTQSFGVHAFCAEKGISLRESNWLRPVLEINGMWGGYTGSGFKTVIPSAAHAKLSCRLVSTQDPTKIGKSLGPYLQQLAPAGIQISTTMLHGAPAYRSASDSSIVKTAALAYEEVFRKPCRYLFCGASVPIIVDLAQVTGAQVAMIGVGLADDNIHAPNEHFGLDRFEWGFLTIGRIIDQLSSS